MQVAPPKAFVRQRTTGARLAGLLASAALLCALEAPTAAADAVRARAGEHGGFSRVALPMRPPEGWRAETRPGGVTLWLPGGPEQVDPREVTRSRKAHRVVGLKSRRQGGQTVVELDFNCACRAEVYALGDRALVIDVRDPDNRASTDASGGAGGGGGAAQARQTQSAPKSRAEQVAKAREVLMRQLQAAASQGLIAFKEPDPAADDPAADDAARDAARDAPLPKTGAAASPAPKPASTSAADTPAKRPSRADAAARAPSAARPERPKGLYQGPTPVAAPPPPPPPEPPCLPDRDFDMDAWVEDRPFGAGLAARRGVLFDDLNKIDAKAVERLMQFYLGHALGLEAAHTARAFAVDTERAALLRDLGDALAGRPPRPGGPFDRSAACPGRHGLWQAAALAETDPDGALDAFAASTEALALTPNPLRRRLGGRIGRAAAEAGVIEPARDILALLARDGLEPSVDMLWIEALIALDEGRVLAGRRALDMIVERRAPSSPRALQQFADTLEEEIETALAERTAERLGDYALQYRGSEIGMASSLAEARLRARFRDLSGAVAAIDRAGQRADAAAQERLAEAKRQLVEREVAKLEDDPTSAAAIDAVRALEHLQGDPEADGLRARIAVTLILMNAPSLVELAIDDETAARSAEANAAREAARMEAAALASPVVATGAVSADADAAGAAETAEPASGAPANDAQSPAPPADPVELADPADPADPADGGAEPKPAGGPDGDEPAGGFAIPSIGQARDLIDAVDVDLKRLKEMLRDG